MSTMATPGMKLQELRQLGIKQTWSQWCDSCRRISAGRTDAPHPPEFAASAKSQEPWITYWRDGISARDAMERVAGRKLK